MRSGNAEMPDKEEKVWDCGVDDEVRWHWEDW